MPEQQPLKLAAVEGGLSPTEIAEYEERHVHVLALKQQIGKSFWEFGLELKAIRDRQLYLAGDYDTFEQYLGSPEVSIDRSTAYDWIGIVETFSALYVEPSDIADIEWSKLRKIRRVVIRNPEQVQEWLSKARVLSRSDLSKELMEYRGQRNGQACKDLFVEELAAIRSYSYQVERELETGKFDDAAEVMDRLINIANEVVGRLRQSAQLNLMDKTDHAPVESVQINHTSYT